MTNLELALRFLSNTGPLVSAYREAKGQTRRFVSDARKEFESLSKAWHGTVGKIAGIGLGYGAYRIAAQSAQMDKQLIRIGQTAGVSKDRVRELRKELFAMSQKTGQGPETIAEGFDKLIQSGAGWEQARSMIQGINVATAVTGANAELLANAMTTASTAFTELDLSKAEVAQTVLDKMTVAGRQGNAELQNLSDIFSRVAVNAKTAGMSFDQTLAFIESLSLMEKSPERLATLADSTLRLFTNQRYLQQVQKAGFKIFDSNGARRDAFAVLADIKKKYSSLASDQERSQFIAKLLKGADLDTVRGIRVLLTEGMLDAANKFTRKISEASGTLERDIGSAIDNAVDQSARLKNAMRSAADAFAKPINRAAATAIGQALKPQEEGGLGLTSGQMIGGSAALGLTAWLLGGKIKGAAGKWMQGGAETAANVAAGKALEAAAGVQPVFVVNWPSNMVGNGGITGILGGQRGNGFDPNMITFGAGGAAGGLSKLPWWKFAGSGLGRGALSKFIGLAGPVGLAASTTYMAEGLLSGGVNMLSGGKYSDYGDALMDLLSGGKISKGYEAGLKQPKIEQKTQIFIDGKEVAPARVTSETRSNTGSLLN
jgi:TP901 family phage tail tape measure protein